MAEPSRSGCFTYFIMLLAAILGAYMAAPHSNALPPTEIVTTVTLAPIGNFTADELNQAATVIQKRLMGLGLLTATIETADASIRLGLPQIENLEDVLKTLTARGLLEFVDFSDVPDIGFWTGRDILTTGQGDHPISDTAEKNPVTKQPFETVLTGEAIVSASVSLNAQFGNQGQVNVAFSDEAAKVLGDYTHTHMGKALAIVLDGKVLSVPIIQAEISAEAVITGNLTVQDARRLAVQLAGGALPFQMQARAISVLRGDFGLSVSTATPNP
jgi:preprotein translocase subunit SecD